MFSRLASAGVASLLVGAAGIAALKSDRLASRLARTLEAQAASRLHLELRIGALQLALLPPGLEMQDVSLGDGAEGAWQVHMQAVRLRPRLWPSTTGVPVIGELALRGVRARVELDRRTPPPGPTAHRRPARAFRLPLDIRHLAVTELSLTAVGLGHTLNLRHASFESHPAAGGRLWAVQLPEGTLLRPGADSVPWPLALTGALRLVGSLDRPEALEVLALSASLRGVHAEARGRVELGLPPSLQLSCALAAPLASLRALLPELPPLGGDAHLEVDLRGSALSPAASLRGEVEGLSWHGRPVGHLNLEGTYGDAVLVVESLRLVAPTGGALTGSGQLHLAGPRPLTASLRLHELSLAHVLGVVAAEPPPPLRLPLLGDVHVEGRLSPLDLQVELALTTHQVALLGANGRPRLTLGLDQAALKARARVQGAGTELREVELTSGSSTLHLRGHLPHSGGRPLHLTVDTDALQLADLGPLAGLAWQGQGLVQAEIGGTVADPHLAATGQFDGLAVAGRPLGRVALALRLDRRGLALERLTLRQGQGGVLAGTARLDWRAAPVQLDVALGLSAVQLGDLAVAAGMGEAWARRLAASLSGRLGLTGPWRAPRGSLHLQAPSLSVDGIQLGPLRVDGASSSQPGVLGTVGLSLRPHAGASLSVELSLRPEGHVAIAGEVERMPLATLAAIVGDLPLGGALSGHFELAGPPTALSGTSLGHVDQLAAFGMQLERADWRARAEGGRLRLSCSLLAGDLDLEADLALAGELQHSARLQFRAVDLQRLGALPPGLSATLSGAASSRGPLSRLQGIVAAAELTAAEVRYRQLRLTPEGKVALTYERGSLALTPTVWLAPGLRGELAGSLGPQGELKGEATVRADAAVLARSLGAVGSATGPIELKLAIGGSLRAPTWAGEGELRGVSLRLSQMDQAIEQVAARVLVRGRTLVLQNGHARLGRGQLHFSGEAALDGSAELNLRLQLAQVAVRPLANLDATLTGELQLQGPWEDLALKGDLAIDSLRYTARLDVTRLLERRQAPPLKVPAMDPSRAVRLAIKLHGERNLVIAGSLLEAELQAHLTLTGTSVRPGLLGNVTALNAKARYRENVFRVQRASVDFVDEYRVVMDYQAQAHTEACQMQIDLNVAGNTEHGGAPEVTLYGRDAQGGVDPQDVYACLQFGLRLRDFSGSQGQGGQAPGLGDTWASGLDALWTVTGLDEKVKRLLPPGVVDEVRLTSGLTHATSYSQPNTVRLLVRKNLGKRVGLRYSRALGNTVTDNALSLEYKLTDRATMESGWFSKQFAPTNDFGLDLRLNWEMQ